MRDFRNVNIWKQEPTSDQVQDAFMDSDIAELNLSVRSYNCLKRVGCNSIREVLQYMGEDGQGLRKIRNLGARSEREIIENIDEFKEAYARTHPAEMDTRKKTIIKPARSMWDVEIKQFHLSTYAMERLSACGLKTVRDLYATNPKQEPGWYAVRELFEKIPSSR